MAGKVVVIGMLGVTLDRGGQKRWDHWRPTLSLLSHEELLIDRLELLHQRKFHKTAKQVVEDAERVSPETTVRSHHVEFDNAWDFEEVYSKLLDFVDGYAFDPDREDYLVHMTTGTHVAQICLYLLTEARYIPGKLIQSSPPTKRGADGPGTYSIIDLDLSKYDAIASRFAIKVQDDVSYLKSGIETRNPRFNALMERIEHVALVSPAPILLTGKTGVGKSRLARRIFELKKRRNQVEGELVEVNCATLRGDGAMSTLFGHAKGAFTGAQTSRKGLLVAANQGLLFLDEIGELGLDEQAMLLRAIEQRVFLPMGSDTEVSSDFQLIAGTNRDLRIEVEKGAFREDLLARINLWTFPLPELRERREDIEPNLDFEIRHAEVRLGHRVSFNKQARLRFLDFAHRARWSGNFRDFRAAVERMATLAGGERISEVIVDDEIQRLNYAWRRAGGDADTCAVVDDVLGDRSQEIDLFDRTQLECVLRVCRQSSNMSDAGRKLFAVSRSKRASTNDSDRIRKYLSRFGLAWRDLQS
ncbi:MAG: RNA repair transcriptional activator RtcR [Myxococcota bacterium]